jgi:hypothetical protein
LAGGVWNRKFDILNFDYNPEIIAAPTRKVTAALLYDRSKLNFGGMKTHLKSGSSLRTSTMDMPTFDVL